MHLIENWILRAGMPLILAKAKGKRKPVKKKVKRPAATARTRVKRSRVNRKARPSKRPTPRALRGKKVTARGRTPAQVPAAPAVAPKPVESEPPPKPVPPIGRAILLSPENEKFVDSFHPTFRWLSVGGATRYEIAWGEDPAFHVCHAIFSISTEAAVPVEKPLSLGKAYYWRVRGGNESGWSPWSAVASFRVLEETG